MGMSEEKGSETRCWGDQPQADLESLFATLFP